MNISDLLHRLANPSSDPDEVRDTMTHAARLILLMQDRINYLCDTNEKLQDRVDRLILDVGLKDQGYIN